MRLFLIFHLFHLLLYESDSMICADDDDDDDGMEDEQKNQLIILKIVALLAPPKINTLKIIKRLQTHTKLFTSVCSLGKLLLYK
mgnify:CR=1 FL=1